MKQHDEDLRSNIAELIILLRRDTNMGVLVARETSSTSIGHQMIETDRAYYERLYQMAWGRGILTNTCIATLLNRMVQRLYVARNIALDGPAIEQVLRDFDEFVNRANDHNGEISEHDLLVQIWKRTKALQVKYQCTVK